MRVNQDKPQALALVRFKTPQSDRACVRLDKTVTVDESEPATVIYVTFMQYTQSKPALQANDAFELSNHTVTDSQPEKEGGLPFYLDTCDCKGCGQGSVGSPVFNKRRELLGFLTGNGLVCTPGIVKNLETDIPSADKENCAILEGALQRESTLPAMTSSKPKKNSPKPCRH